MNCQEIEVRLNDHLDGILSASENAEVERHLESCLNCKEELLRLRNLMAETAALPKEMIPARDLWPKVAGRIALTKQTASRSFFGLPLNRTVGALAVAAVLILVAAGIFWKIKQSSTPFWEVGRLAGSPKVGSEKLFDTGKLRVGEWLETDDSSRAVISVGNIGHVQVEPNSRIRLVEARLTEHRLALQKGGLEAQISAPPRLFFVETPSATAVDMGCVYRLTVDESGGGQLEVTFGWVSLVRDGRESMVPAGAVCLIRSAIGPGTPFFKNKPARFQQALERLDFEQGGLPELEIILNESQSSDAFTLWHLLPRVAGVERELLYGRMAELTPLPEGVTSEGILRLDAEMLLRWKEEIDLKTEFFSEPQTKTPLTERSTL
ncbi:MAG: zf-HC2 domain-containing protein [candidate division Zixibacteria bacterium]|nr:zf-HC2 domain-containing protein [candidate division Zixibacteria bacterium]